MGRSPPIDVEAQKSNPRASCKTMVMRGIFLLSESKREGQVVNFWHDDVVL
jgi:hypothetical protein